ncbi:MAG: hypothetical protein KGR26_08755 [Cyanobacteria bacterium REEB65]|nr:hypothetical protein [Cyanobacteria bacterium REEB65]
MTDTPETTLLKQRLDPTKPKFISIFGMKGSGKSVLAEAYWRSWPYSCLSIDPTGDFNAGDRDIEVLHDPLPNRLTMPDKGKRTRWVYRPDPGSATYEDDLDRAVGLAFRTPKDHPFLLQIDEIAEVTSATRTGPNMRRVLHQHRHQGLFVICCGPRTKDINPLVLSQADYAMFFRMPHELDQDRAAQICGISRQQFTEAMRALPPYHYLRYDSRPDEGLVKELARREGLSEQEARDELRLVECPPVPLSQARPGTTGTPTPG